MRHILKALVLGGTLILLTGCLFDEKIDPQLVDSYQPLLEKDRPFLILQDLSAKPWLTEGAEVSLETLFPPGDLDALAGYAEKQGYNGFLLAVNRLLPGRLSRSTYYQALETALEKEPRAALLYGEPAHLIREAPPEKLREGLRMIRQETATMWLSDEVLRVYRGALLWETYFTLWEHLNRLDFPGIREEGNLFRDQEEMNQNREALQFAPHPLGKPGLYPKVLSLYKKTVDQ